MQVLCEQCDAVIPAEDVNLDTLMAKCVACDAVFSIAHHDRESVPLAAGESRPGGVTVHEDVSHLRLERSWRNPGVAFMIIFTLFWDGFLVFWYFLAFTQGGPLMMKIFPALHVAIGIAITWYTLASLLNKTIVEVGYERLTVRIRPIKWWGNHTLESATVTRIWVEKGSLRENEQSTWNLMADTTDGKRLALVRHVRDRDQVAFMAREIIRFLGLTD